MQRPYFYRRHLPITIAAILLFFANAAYGISPTSISPAVPLSCSWPIPVENVLDSTYRWHGLYLGGVERAITAVVSGETIELSEKNAGAVNGLNYQLQLTGGILDTSQADSGRMALAGRIIAGTVDADGTQRNIDGGSWSFVTTDCGTTFRLAWSTSGNRYNGEYVFGPTGYEFAHGANMASCAIYKDKE